MSQAQLYEYIFSRVLNIYLATLNLHPEQDLYLHRTQS